MVDVRFVAPDLRKLDELRREALSLPFFEDERPLRGALGLIDWRLCGALSQLILDARLSGQRGETLLVPARDRLSVEKLFLFGLGSSNDFGIDVYDEAVDRMLWTLSRARVRASVCTLPGRTTLRIDPETAIERFVRIASHDEDIHDEVTVVEGAEAQKAMGPVLERERRRARAHARKDQ